MSFSLTQDQKLFIVQRLAVGCGPGQVIRDVKEEFGIDVPRSTVKYYNPRSNRHKMAAYWVEVFETTRSAFLKQLADIPLTHQAFRLQMLQDSLDRVLGAAKINESMIHDIVERAAKEVGGIYTNRRELTGSEGKPLVDTTEFAKSLFKELVEKDGLTVEQAAAFVTKEYGVPEEVLISEAEN